MTPPVTYKMYQFGQKHGMDGGLGSFNTLLLWTGTAGTIQGPLTQRCQRYIIIIILVGIFLFVVRIGMIYFRRNGGIHLDVGFGWIGGRTGQ
jgi:hypothetical protein